MTREKIIEVFSRKAKEIIIAEYKVDDRYIFTNQGKEAIADELLALIEQEKKEQVREILNDIFSDVTAGDLGEFLGWGWIYDIDEARAIAKEYGVEL